jgi:hypothetical protein
VFYFEWFSWLGVEDVVDDVVEDEKSNGDENHCIKMYIFSYQGTE